MKFAISPHMRAIDFPPISEVLSWAAEQAPDRPLLDLCQAVPAYGPAPQLLDHLQQVLRDPQTARYSADEGLPEVREALCDYYRRRYGAVMQPDRLCLTIGASQAFWLAMVVLCRPGDEVVVPLPCYFDHVMGLQALGVRCVFVPFDEAAGGLPDPEALAGYIGPRTRAVLLVSPSNPAGTILPPATLARFYQLARQRGIALLVDETYNAFIPELARPHELFVDPDWGDHFVHIASFGKTFALTGFRAGLLAASSAFIREALKVQDSMAVCQPCITQQAVLYGVRQLDGWVLAKNRLMQRRHDLFRQAFARPDNPFTLVTSGAFFAWVRHPFTALSGRQVSHRLCRQQGLLTLGGEIFGPGLERYLRLAFGNLAEERIAEAAQRFCACRPD